MPSVTIPLHGWMIVPCTAAVSLKVRFARLQGGSSEPPRTTPGYGPDCFYMDICPSPNQHPNLLQLPILHLLLISLHFKHVWSVSVRIIKLIVATTLLRHSTLTHTHIWEGGGKGKEKFWCTCTTTHTTLWCDLSLVLCSAGMAILGSVRPLLHGDHHLTTLTVPGECVI